jgi:hypothetical protein
MSAMAMDGISSCNPKSFKQRSHQRHDIRTTKACWLEKSQMIATFHHPTGFKGDNHGKTRIENQTL